MISFEIEGAPTGKGRPRFYNGHAVTPQKTRSYEQEIALRARVATKEKLTGAVAVEIIAYFEIPKSLTKSKKKALYDSVYVQKKPDIDNITKIILDGVNGVCYTDDSQVALIKAEKRYTQDKPRVTVTIWGLEKKGKSEPEKNE